MEGRAVFRHVLHPGDESRRIGPAPEPTADYRAGGSTAKYPPGVLFFPLGGFVGVFVGERGSAQDPAPQDSYRGSYRGSESPPAEVVLF